ncbi:hypothetical protein CFOL_v3_05664 [Cephalotus follicularis]|uniref:Uncharacterized protein n=1 Tax=Cephalotus follicularis TaxID=3775 RepID=A0A1Q3B2F3_CEPFO|nr:hypothetical protein CFOL_v3_05664 [Cephalotus follicularis]
MELFYMKAQPLLFDPIQAEPLTLTCEMKKMKSSLKPSLSILFSTSPSNKLVRPFCTHSLTPKTILTSTTTTTQSVSRVKVADADTLKLNWLDSLSYPLPHPGPDDKNPDLTRPNADWVIGIDPDLSGALALLKTDRSGSSAQVFDSPYLPVLVGKRIRKRLDAKSMVQLIRSFDAPIGTTAYIEQSIPYPQDGKQGWWSGGFGYGLWIGILVASGFSVVPVPSLLWKNEFELCGGGSSKDESRRMASTLFPSLSSLLTRKKDHGRADALLIAAYGKGLKIIS